MERIHRKSALTETSDLLRAADARGAELLWQRYERQLPLCAFTSNGLNCRKCFLGPCRISPFGAEPSRGVCGADRDQIVMESLFQATLEGALESAQTLHALDPSVGERALPDIAQAMPRRSAEHLATAGLLPVRRSDLFGVQNSFFSHRAYLPQTLRDLSRLGLLHYAFLCQGADAIAGARPEGVLDPLGVNVLIVGQPPAGLLQALGRSAGCVSGKRVNLLVSGASVLPPSADQGSPELLLGTNVHAILLAANAGWPWLEPLAAQYGIPVVAVPRDVEVERIAAGVIDQACGQAQRGSSSEPSGVRARATAGGFSPQQVSAIGQAFGAGRIRGIAVLFGEAGAKQTFFERTLALMEAALAERAIVLVGGGLGAEVEALAVELGKRQAKALSAFAAELGREGLAPVSAFGSAFELPRVVSLGQSIPLVFAFPEFYRASTWACATSMLSLGFPVQIGARLPFWGSPELTKALLTEWPGITAGKLLAAPALPDARSQAEELAAHFRGGRA